MVFGGAATHLINEPRESSIKGDFSDIAVDCWFTSTGRMIPRLIKIKLPDESILTLENITVCKCEDKRHLGIRTKIFYCNIEHNNRIKKVMLQFNQEDCTWKMIT